MGSYFRYKHYEVNGNICVHLPPLWTEVAKMEELFIRGGINRALSLHVPLRIRQYPLRSNGYSKY